MHTHQCNIQSSSAAAERVSLLKQLQGDQQSQMLEDYIETSLMLQFNNNQDCDGQTSIELLMMKAMNKRKTSNRKCSTSRKTVKLLNKSKFKFLRRNAVLV
jgi:hypothetical protein